ncbi:o-succinylbenzoate--CoA ligase [Corynebacterium pseudotuberculosis]|uniref:o-succinylbenzoate--CoA ligase n=1 Tax=Corynebacterium pseudotuberculosis TaxID=1719 RepID=UPI0002660382|nr:o-succinylbenzoate--CoA ligase [Corynebacterium pseudotuberculosis]AFM06663.1 o-succinylbenzoate--CoA ligase [Corynebacterium pseudotuberculosis Cp162]APG81018.1 O-succinylbenzoic acid--CoA ligase [Corynebacterium pseudotuberculosis]WFP67491.1 o-succinylbenzoate--CoA ligase [Corynebacterium pseudotuberculosis]
MHVLEPLVVPTHNPAGILDRLEQAIVGQRSFLPLPSDDKDRAELLRRTQRVGHPIDPDIALVMSTSGSTGIPKGAMLTAGNLVSSADATHQFLGGEAQWLLAMPAHHIAGMQILVRSIIAGYDPIVVDVSRGFNVAVFATAAASVEGERVYTSLTPLQLLKAMDTLVGIEALRVFTAILVGGAPLRADDRRAAKELGINVVTTYGASETSGGCVYNGRPVPGATVRVIDERIHLGGPMIAQGYRNIPDHHAFSQPGWFSTSDAGILNDGILEVVGRLDNVIDSGGLKIHPEVLERKLCDVPGVTAACVVGLPDRRFGHIIVAAYEGNAHPTTIISALDDLPRWQLPKDIRRVESLPLIGPGKVDRRGVTALFTQQ